MRCQKTTDLLDGEARCKSVDKMTSARVVPTTVLPTDGRHQRSNREGGSMLTLLPASLEHGLLSSASRFPPLQSIILRLLWACRNFMIGSLHALCSHVFTCQKMAPERRAGTVGRRSSDLGHGAASTPQRAQVLLFCKNCTGSATLATMKRWRQYRGELHAPDSPRRKPNPWERLVFGAADRMGSTASAQPAHM